jgi:superfamily II DNA helicase RecQ
MYIQPDPSTLTICLQLGVSVLCMSATLTKAHIADLEYVLDMTGPTFINMGTNRPNLELRVIPMRHTGESFLDLLYAMPELADIGQSCWRTRMAEMLTPLQFIPSEDLLL